MKNTILSILCLLAISNVRASIVLEGRLSDDHNISGQISKVILTDKKEMIKLVNEYIEAESCKNGRFEVVEVSEGIFELKSVINCDEWHDETAEVSYCPENFAPVCGEILMDEYGGKALQSLVTFSNGCELYKAKAAFVKKGRCF